MSDWVDRAGDVLLAASFVLAVACVVSYAIKTGGAWRASEIGRHLMAFMAAMAAVLTMSFLRIVIVDVLGHEDLPAFRMIRIIVFVGIPVVLGWRLKIIVFSEPTAEEIMMDPQFAKALGLATRNAVQVLVPVLALVSAGTITGADALSVVVAAALAFVASLAKSALDWHASSGAAWYLKVLDRVAPAAIGAVLALWPTDLAGALSANWAAIGEAALGAAGTAFAMWLLEILPAEKAGLRRAA